MKLYAIPACDTVKKARRFLDDNHIAYQFHDYKKLGADAAVLRAVMKQSGWQALINRAGTTWRGLSDAEKAAVTDEQSALALMMAHPSLIRRPILQTPDEWIIGFDESAYERLVA